eukprot:46297_1
MGNQKSKTSKNKQAIVLPVPKKELVEKDSILDGDKLANSSYNLTGRGSVIFKGNQLPSDESMIIDPQLQIDGDSDLGDLYHLNIDNN